MKKILIVAPIRNRAWILPKYLEKLSMIRYPKYLISFYFIVNDSTDTSKMILEDWKKEKQDHYKSIEIKEVNFGYPNDWGEDRSKKAEFPRQKYTYDALSKLRTKILDYARITDNDYIFSIDSDILVNKDILWNLLREKKDIIAGLLINNISANEKITAYNFLPLEGHRLELPKKTFKVKTTGACYLISRKVFMNKNIDYISNGGIAEDTTFCKKARLEGYDSWVLNDKQEHIINKQRYLKGESQFQPLLKLKIRRGRPKKK